MHEIETPLKMNLVPCGSYIIATRLFGVGFLKGVEFFFIARISLLHYPKELHMPDEESFRCQSNVAA